ncbi:hypothetical protein vseg_019340 [Gypsophila vaccaria]
MKTPTSSQYPVLENKPIDQWKVTELKEELKRRRLKTGGLKDELIRRLDEALRAEMDEVADSAVAETVPENVVADVPDNLTEQPVVETGDSGVDASGIAGDTMGNAEQVVGGATENVGTAEGIMGDAVVDVKENVGTAKENDVTSEMDVNDSKEQSGQDEKFEEQQSALGNDRVLREETVTVTDVTSVALGDVVSEEQHPGLAQEPSLGEEIVTKTDVSSVDLGDKVTEEQQSGLGDNPVLGQQIVTGTDVGSMASVDVDSKEQQSGLVDDPVSGEGIETATEVVCSTDVGGNVNKGISSEKAVGSDGFIDGKSTSNIGDSGKQEHTEDVKPAHEEVKLDSSDQNNQVSEVSTSLGFPVKSNNSVSTDSVSIIEKNDVKDNLIANNLKLESDVKPEMVLPSSSDLLPDGGDSHLRDVDEPHENKISVEETDNIVAHVDMSQKNYSADLGSPEKLNLDRSSGDDFMEEDAFESKQIDSKYDSEDVGEKAEKNGVTTDKAESTVDVTMDTDLPTEKKVTHAQKNDVPTLSDKRKLPDEAVVNKPAKRQHRWKKETDIVTEPQVSHIPLASPQDVPQSTALRKSFSRTDSMGANNDPPKEREVPPSTKAATNSLRIDHFLRPFTLKAVQELLGKSGTVARFWMDHIKTHCYVTYSSVEEAVETRNAVYNLQWPPNGGRQLVAEFVDPEEVKLRLEPPTAPAPPMNPVPNKGTEVPTAPQPSPRLPNLRQQPTLPPPPPIQNQGPARERVPPPPPLIEKVDAPIVTLDDLFRKTKATPRIYYLPLSDEQVAARRKNPK